MCYAYLNIVNLEAIFLLFVIFMSITPEMIVLQNEYFTDWCIFHDKYIVLHIILI